MAKVRATATPAQVRRHRFRVQQLDRAAAARRSVTDAAVLGVGVQDTGPDGALWALAVRGVPVTAHEWPRDLALAWTLRGAPHAYRRADLGAVQRAVRPYSDTDAGKRIYDAAKPLRAAGIRPTDALAHAARTMRDVVVESMPKGEVSTRMTAELDDPYLRWCGGCQATHMWEMTFRLCALHAGLELEPGTSPPVLRRIPGWPASRVGAVERPDRRRDDPSSDLVPQLVHLLGPTAPALVAALLDAPTDDVEGRWPADVVTVLVEGEERAVLATDVDALQAAAGPPHEPAVRLVGPYDLFMQARDRDVLVPDRARHKALWPGIGRPGVVLADGEVVGTWRPRTKGKRLALEVDPWEPWSTALRRAVADEHGRLAEFRGLAPA